MKSITMLELRQAAEKIIQEVKNRQPMVLTYRGEPVVRLEPFTDQEIEDNDPFYSLDKLADESGISLSNSEIDQFLYDPPEIEREIDNVREEP